MACDGEEGADGNIAAGSGWLQLRIGVGLIGRLLPIHYRYYDPLAISLLWTDIRPPMLQLRPVEYDTIVLGVNCETEV